MQPPSRSTAARRPCSIPAAQTGTPSARSCAPSPSPLSQTAISPTPSSCCAAGRTAALRCSWAGRAAFGDPWLFERLRAALRGKTPPELPPLADRVDTALQQFALALEDKGEHIACLEARKHFAWYLRGVPHSGFYKEQISNISAFSDIERLAKEIKRDLR